MIVICRHRVFVEVEIREIILVAVPEQSLVGDEDIADLTQHDAELVGERLNQKVFRRIDMVRKKRVRQDKPRVLGDEGAYRKRVFHAVSRARLHGEMEKTAGPESGPPGIYIQ